MSRLRNLQVLGTVNDYAGVAGQIAKVMIESEAADLQARRGDCRRARGHLQSALRARDRLQSAIGSLPEDEQRRVRSTVRVASRAVDGVTLDLMDRCSVRR